MRRQTLRQVPQTYAEGRAQPSNGHSTSDADTANAETMVRWIEGDVARALPEAHESSFDLENGPPVVICRPLERISPGDGWKSANTFLAHLAKRLAHHTDETHHAGRGGNKEFWAKPIWIRTPACVQAAWRSSSHATPPHPTLSPSPSCPIPSHPTHPIPCNPNQSNPSHPNPFHPIHSVPFHPISSHPMSSNVIPCRVVPSYSTQSSYHIPSHPIPSHLLQLKAKGKGSLSTLASTDQDGSK